MRTGIDNGHGGSDPGAVSPKGQKESNTNLNIAAELANLEKEEGNVAIVTNPLNLKMELGYRFDLLNTSKVDVSLSIHNNAGGGERSEIFYQLKNAKSRILAESIKKEIQKEFPGRVVQLKTKESTKHPGKDYFAALAIPKMPAVLIECAFMDSKDIALIDTLNEQKRWTLAIHRGLTNYYTLTK